MSVSGVAPAPVVQAFVPQSVAELRYVLCPAALDPRQWQLLDQRRIALPGSGGTLDLAIIGASHVLTLRSEDAALTEVLACLPAVSSPVAAVVERTATGAWAVAAQCGRWRYTTAFREERYDAAGFAVARAAIAARRPALLRSFPRGPYASEPVTAIDYRIAAQVVTVATFHTYPGDSAIAVTETTIARS